MIRSRIIDLALFHFFFLFEINLIFTAEYTKPQAMGNTAVKMEFILNKKNIFSNFKDKKVPTIYNASFYQFRIFCNNIFMVISGH